MSKPLLGYWDIRGFGQPIRFLFAYIGVDFDEKTYEIDNGDVWFEQDKFNLGLDFPNLPYLIDGKVRLSETRAILRYIAKEKGKSKNLIPNDDESSRTLDMVENVLWNMWEALFKVCYEWSDEHKADFEKSFPSKFQQLSKFVGQKKFLLGNQVTYADFILYEMLFGHTSYDANLLKTYPNLEAYKTNFESIPEIAAFIKSAKYIPTKCSSPQASHPI